MGSDKLLAQPGSIPGRTDNNPLSVIKAGFIGVGNRARSRVKDTLALPDIEIAAICDIQQTLLDAALTIISDRGRLMLMTLLNGMP